MWNVPILMLMFLFFGFVILACEAATVGEAEQIQPDSTLNQSSANQPQAKNTPALNQSVSPRLPIQATIGTAEVNITRNPGQSESPQTQSQSTDDLRAINIRLIALEGRVGEIEDAVRIVSTLENRIASLEQEVLGRRLNLSDSRIDELEWDVRKLGR